MDAWQTLWRDLKNCLHRKRIVALDVETYETLRLVAQRRECSPQEVTAQLIDQAAYIQDTQSWVLQCWECLSPRQKQIAAYVCRGDSTRQIASQLNISPTTVKSHVEIILQKFNLHSRSALRQVLASWDLSASL